MSSGLEGAVALVTGAVGGQGSAVCRRLAVEGADVLAVDVKSAESVVKEVRAQGRQAWAAAVDLGDRDGIRRKLASRIEQLPSLDLIICCAGLLTRKPFAEEQDDDWDRLIAVNLTSAFVVTQLGWPKLLVSSRAAIVYITSKAAWSPTAAQSPAYVASKGGLQALVYAAAVAGAPHGIRANGIAPGPIATPMLGDAAETAAHSTPLGRVGTPEDIAAAAYYLASPESGFVTGTVLNVSGGRQIG